MYIDSIRIENLRALSESGVTFLHREQDLARLGLPPSRHPNINLLVGTNGSGKTTLLQAIALAALGPAVEGARFLPSNLTRREPAGLASKTRSVAPPPAIIEASFVADEPRGRGAVPSRAAGGAERRPARVVVEARASGERVRWAPDIAVGTRASSPSAGEPRLLFGYGATRLAGMPAGERAIPTRTRGDEPPVAGQVQGLFEEAHRLTSLSAWLPQLRRGQRARYDEVVSLLNRLLAPGQCRLTGEVDGGECVFACRGVKLPFAALSDGCRAYLAWVGDLLRRLCAACPPGRRFVALRGLVLVDDVDLHLSPEWQMQLLPALAHALPALQFVLSTQSPLLVGSLQWTNLIAMQPGPRASHTALRLPEPVHGLDADQVLLSRFFGLASTRAPDKQRRLRRLTMRARQGDLRAAQEFLEGLSRGEEPAP